MVWHSWQRGRFRYQRTRVRIQSLAIFIEQLFTVNFVEKTKINEKEAGNGPVCLKKIFI